MTDSNENSEMELNENPESPEVVSEPTKKRAYKPRAAKVKSETLDTAEQPMRKSRPKKASIENTAKQLEGIHKMVSMLPNLGFMQIAPEEARVLAEALLGVADEYDIQISGKTGATIQLVSAAAMIYAPRAIYAIGERKKAKKVLQENQEPPEFSEPLTVATNSGEPTLN